MKLRVLLLKRSPPRKKLRRKLKLKLLKSLPKRRSNKMSSRRRKPQRRKRSMLSHSLKSKRNRRSKSLQRLKWLSKERDSMTRLNNSQSPWIKSTSMKPSRPKRSWKRTAKMFNWASIPLTLIRSHSPSHRLLTMTMPLSNSRHSQSPSRTWTTTHQTTPHMRTLSRFQTKSPQTLRRDTRTNGLTQKTTEILLASESELKMNEKVLVL